MKKEELKFSSIYEALAGFQQEVPALFKNTKGFGYNYTDLSEIIKIINPYMKKYQLGFTQLLQKNEVNGIRTIIFHISTGQTLESYIDLIDGVQLKGMNDYQSVGSGFTYYRRYSISSILGNFTDKDTDASGDQVKKLPTIDAKRFQSAIEAINAGKYTREELESKFALTEGQTDLINAL
jgi:hypothetical protein